MHKHTLTSILVPTISLILIISAFLFLKPATTGLTTFSPDESQNVNADISLSTKNGEVIPPSAVVEIWVDDKKAEMTISEFIARTGEESELEQGSIPDFNFQGIGYTGEHIYKLTLADFNIDRSIEKGQHTFITRIVYRGKTLYEKQNNIVIS